MSPDVWELSQIAALDWTVLLRIFNTSQAEDGREEVDFRSGELGLCWHLWDAALWLAKRVMTSCLHVCFKAELKIVCIVASDVEHILTNFYDVLQTYGHTACSLVAFN